jgi:hypothetical protein
MEAPCCDECGGLVKAASWLIYSSGREPPWASARGMSHDEVKGIHLRGVLNKEVSKPQLGKDQVKKVPIKMLPVEVWGPSVSWQLVFMGSGRVPTWGGGNPPMSPAPMGNNPRVRETEGWVA